MARHNRDARGTDQRGTEYEISYQPDWVRQIKVTRTLDTGRQSTKTLFRNPGRKEQKPGSKVRTRIRSRRESVDFEIGVDDPQGIVTRIVVETALPGRPGETGNVVFTIDERLPGIESTRRARRA
jgi:hypothetical protein